MAVVVVACTEATGAIGLDGRIPWDLPADRKRFAAITKQPGAALIMGRRTFESVGVLPDRETVVVTRRPRAQDAAALGVAGAEQVAFETDLARAVRSRAGRPVFIVGGGEIYDAAMREAGLVERVELTRVFIDAEGDARFPLESLAADFYCARSAHGAQNGIEFCYETWLRRPRRAGLGPRRAGLGP